MLTPTIAVVTNIDREHMDYYHDMEDVRACFTSFVNKVPFYGSSILCLDDPNVQAIIPRIERRRITYGLSAQADVSAHGVRHDREFGSTFTVWRSADVVGEIELHVPGMHNVYNSLAAIAVGFELEVPFAEIAGALSTFTGAHRRFQLKAEVDGVLVIDDYGHHPTEIRATLAAAKIGSGGRRTLVLFQPHRYTRTHDLMGEFARSFNNADTLLITDIYAASEEPIQGVSGETLTEAIQRYGHKDVRYVGGLESAAQTIREHIQPGDMVITLGAGTVYRVGDQIVELLRGRSEAKGV
jgi:UDP-N-acetylmuramate--alanine ligase